MLHRRHRNQCDAQHNEGDQQDHQPGEGVAGSAKRYIDEGLSVRGSLTDFACSRFKNNASVCTKPGAVEPVDAMVILLSIWK